MTAHAWEVLVKAAAGGGTIVLLYWLLRAIFLPNQTCRWCKKHPGRNWWSNGERSGPCWFCHGSPRRHTWGARLVRGKVRFHVGRWGK